LAREHGIDLRPSRVDKFRESYSEVRNDDPKLVNRIYASCKVVHELRDHTVAHGMFYRCPQSYFIPKVLHEGTERDAEADGIRISDDDGFGTRLLDFLNSDTPPASCTNCLGTAGRLFTHVQIRKGQFRQAQDRPPTAMFSRRQTYGRLAARGRQRIDPQ
jgi:hypothetical protein